MPFHRSDNNPGLVKDNKRKRIALRQNPEDILEGAVVAQTRSGTYLIYPPSMKRVDVGAKHTVLKHHGMVDLKHDGPLEFRLNGQTTMFGIHVLSIDDRIIELLNRHNEDTGEFLYPRLGGNHLPTLDPREVAYEAAQVFGAKHREQTYRA